MESEMITVNYQKVETLLHDLKAIGANVTADGHRQGLLTRHMLSTLYQAYESYRVADQLPATYEIIYGHAWARLATNEKTKAERQVQVQFRPGSHE